MSPRFRVVLLLALVAAAAPVRAADPCASPPAAGDDDPLSAVKFAFACAKAIPKLVPAEQDRSAYALAVDVAKGCPAPCRAPKEIARYKDAVARVCRILELPDVAGVQARYCPPNATCPCKLRDAECVPPEAGGTRASSGPGATAVPDPAKDEARMRGYAREAKSLELDKTDDLSGLPAAGLDARNPLIVAGKLPEIKAALDEATGLLSFLDKPLLEIKAEEWDVPELAAKLSRLDALLRSADAFRTIKAAGRDDASQAFRAAHDELRRERAELAAKIEKLPKLKAAGEAVGAKLAAYENSGKAEDLPAREDLERIFDSAGLQGLEKAAAMKDFDALFDNAGGRAKSYYEYFGAQIKSKKLAKSADEIAYYGKKIAEPAAFDRAIGGCLPARTASSSAADPARTLDDIDAYAREAVFQCGVKVLQEQGELRGLEEQKAKQGKAFRGQARLDALAKAEADRNSRAAPDGERSLLLPGARPDAPAAASAAPRELRHDLTVAVLTGLSSVRGVPASVAGRAKGWYYHEAGEDVVESRVAGTAAFLDAVEAKAASLRGFGQKLREAKGDRRALLDKADRAIEDWLRRNPKALAEDDPALVAYVRIRAGAASFYQEWINSGTAETGVRFYGSELGLDASVRTIDMAALEKKAGRLTSFADGRTVFASDDGALERRTGPVNAAERASLMSLGFSDAEVDLGDKTYSQTTVRKGGRVRSMRAELIYTDGKPSTSLVNDFDQKGTLVRAEKVESDLKVKTTLTNDGSGTQISVEEKLDGNTDASLWQSRTSRCYAVTNVETHTERLSCNPPHEFTDKSTHNYKWTVEDVEIDGKTMKRLSRSLAGASRGVKITGYGDENLNIIAVEVDLDPLRALDRGQRAGQAEDIARDVVDGLGWDVNRRAPLRNWIEDVPSNKPEKLDWDFCAKRTEAERAATLADKGGFERKMLMQGAYLSAAEAREHAGLPADQKETAALAQELVRTCVMPVLAKNHLKLVINPRSPKGAPAMSLVQTSDSGKRLYEEMADWGGGLPGRTGAMGPHDIKQYESFDRERYDYDDATGWVPKQRESKVKGVWEKIPPGEAAPVKLKVVWEYLSNGEAVLHSEGFSQESAGVFTGGGWYAHPFKTTKTRGTDGRWSSPCDHVDADEDCSGREKAADSYAYNTFQSRVGAAWGQTVEDTKKIGVGYAIEGIGEAGHQLNNARKFVVGGWRSLYNECSALSSFADTSWMKNADRVYDKLLADKNCLAKVDEEARAEMKADMHGEEWNQAQTDAYMKQEPSRERRMRVLSDLYSASAAVKAGLDYGGVVGAVTVGLGVADKASGIVAEQAPALIIMGGVRLGGAQLGEFMKAGDAAVASGDTLGWGQRAARLGAKATMRASGLALVSVDAVFQGGMVVGAAEGGVHMLTAGDGASLVDGFTSLGTNALLMGKGLQDHGAAARRAAAARTAEPVSSPVEAREDAGETTKVEKVSAKSTPASAVAPATGWSAKRFGGWLSEKWDGLFGGGESVPVPDVPEAVVRADDATKAGKSGATPKPPKAPMADPEPKPWPADAVKPPQKPASVPYDRRVSAFEKNAVIRDDALVVNAESGPLDGHGAVLLREPYAGTAAQKTMIARLNALGFEVEFSKEFVPPSDPGATKAGKSGAKPKSDGVAADPEPKPWPKDPVKPPQTVSRVAYDRRVQAFEKNAIIRDDALVANVDSGPLDGHGTVLLREPYRPDSKAQRTTIARLNALGFEVEFPHEAAEPEVSGTEATKVGKPAPGPVDAAIAWAKGLLGDKPPVSSPDAKTLPAKDAPAGKGAAEVPVNLKDKYASAPDLDAKAGQGVLYKSRDGKSLVKVFKLGDKSTSREAVDALVAHNEALRKAGVRTVEMKAVEVSPGKWGIEMPFVAGESMADFINRDWDEDSGSHSELGQQRLKQAKAMLDRIDALTAKDPSRPDADHLTDHRGRQVVDGKVIFDNEDFANFIIDGNGELVNIDPLNMALVMERGAPEPPRDARGSEPDRGRGPPPEPPVVPEPPKPDKSDILAGQKSRLEAFKKEAMEESSLKKLPEGLPRGIKPALQTIFKLFQSRERFFTLMQAFEADVVARSKATGEPLETARENILAEWEKKHGFKPVIELQNKIYRADEWQAMLREGALFKDPNLKDLTSIRAGHGAETHRIQWHIVMRAMEADPGAFGGITKASDLYRGLGVIDYSKLDWEGTGMELEPPAQRDLWYQIFDNFEKNWSSPEFVRPQHGYWPGLGVWD